jgi:predicted  nucleic acid-binding Zn-ribbon protein
MPFFSSMNAFIPLLQELHHIETDSANATPAQLQRATVIRAALPSPVLAHYNRLLVNHAKPIAEVRRGVCGACHLRLASWIKQAAHDDDLHVCENCGAYLVFVPEEPPAAAARATVHRQARLALIRAAVH